MKSIFTVLTAIALLVGTSFAQPPDTLWTKTYGGNSNDCGESVHQTVEGGYIIAGKTSSYGAGDGDVYLIKTNYEGDTLWTRTFGGGEHDYGYSVQQTNDGGYIIAGETHSFGLGSCDVYLIKTDTNGDTVWTKTCGGNDGEYGYCVRQTQDEGYIITGWTRSYGAGSDDVYLIKTDTNGDTVWTRTFGGSSSDVGNSVQQTSDGGYIIAGYSTSFGAGSADIYLVKTDAGGDTLWTKTYGGNAPDFGNCVQQTTDGGYIITGQTNSYGAGQQDVYLIKTNTFGDTVWTKTFGGHNAEYGYCIQQTEDGGYIIAGETSSGPSIGDVYLIKTDAMGDSIWCITIDGGVGYEIQETNDGGYIIAGVTESYGAGQSDVWLIRLVYPPILDLSINSLYFEALEAGSNPDSQFVIISNSGYDSFSYIVSESISWLTLSQLNGTVPPNDTVIVNVDIAWLQPGTYYGNIIVTADSGVFNSPDTISVTLNLYPSNSLSGPLNGIIEAGTYPVIDDIYVEEGDSLIIEPGVTFLFYNEYSFEVFGYLSAVGTEQDNIEFMPDIGISWKGIEFNDSADDNCILEYSIITGSIDQGIECDNCNIIIRYCTVFDNSTDVNGGGIYCSSSNVSIVNCTISGNLAIQDGGGIYIDQGSNPILVNTIIEGNSGNGGIFFNNLTFTDSIFYCDFFNNQGSDFAGNTPPGLGLIFTTNANGDSCDPFFNIYLNPRFINPFESNFHLREDSPCIDAGNPDSPFDPDSTIADIGAFYYDQFVWVKDKYLLNQPLKFTLHTPYPNPFNPSTMLSYSLPKAGNVSLVIYDVKGREIVKFIDEWIPAGIHQMTFDASGLSSGVYFACLQAEGLSQTQKLLLIK